MKKIEKRKRKNRLLELATIRLVEIVGQAAAKISPENQAKYPLGGVETKPRASNSINRGIVFPILFATICITPLSQLRQQRPYIFNL
jgi:hypothetical protein